MPVPAVSANRSRDVDEEQAIKARAAVTLQEATKPKAKSSKMGNKSRGQAVLAGRAARRAAGKDINAEESERVMMEQERQRQAQRAKDALLVQGAQLRKAAAMGNADECRRLIGEGFPLDACDILGRSALHVAALGDHTEAMLVLLDAGIDIDAQDQRGMTALALAAEAGRCDALCTLIDDGADVYIASVPLTHCWTPIMHAAARGHDEILGVLLSAAPALIDSKDCKGLTAMDIARENGHQEAEDVLFLAADSRSVDDAKRDAANARQRVLRRGDSKADLLRIQSARSLGGSRSASFKSTDRGSPPASFKSTDRETDRGSPPWSQPPSPDSQMQDGLRSVAYARQFLARLTGSKGTPKSQSLPSSPEKFSLKRGLTQIFSKWPVKWPVSSDVMLDAAAGDEPRQVV